MGPFEYDVRLNTSTRTAPELNDLPNQGRREFHDLSS